MVKENGMVMMTDEEFKRICKCYEKNLADQKDEHEYETDLICKDYEKTICILKEEHRTDLEILNKRIDFMQTAILELSKGVALTNDMRVSKADFLAIYEKALDKLHSIMEGEKATDKTPDDVDNDIYGHDITVHWHGIYCNCGDGATPYNHIIPGIEGVNDEDPNEYY